MADLTVDKTKVAPVKVIRQFTAPAGEAIDAGMPVYRNTTTGKVYKADASASGTAGVVGVAIQTANQAGITITVVQEGWLDMGAALDALAFEASVYLSDTNTGILADAAGTVSKVVGKVVPAWASIPADRLLEVNL